MNQTSDVFGLVLAAGAGTRFGGPKALASIDGELFVDRALRVLRDGGCQRRIVVLGAGAEEVHRTAALAEAEVVVATDWSIGQSASLSAGLMAGVSGGAGAVVVTLVDQPWIDHRSVSRLIEQWASGSSVAVASYDGYRRHPVLFDATVIPSVISTLTGDAGARQWLDTHPELVTALDCTGLGDPADVDRREDLVR